LFFMLYNTRLRANKALFFILPKADKQQIPI
jgi:hypothetical protein